MKTGMRTKGVLTISAVLFAGFMTAQTAMADPAALHPVLQEFEKAGGKVEFLGHAFGVDGWLVTNPKGGVQYAYTTPEGGLITGMMFAPDGTLETKKQLELFQARTKGEQSAAPVADADKADQSAAPKSEKLYAAVEQAAWVGMGKITAPYLYMFINVTCDHCQHFWRDLEADVEAGKIQVRLIPYGKTKPNRDGGAALLSAGDNAPIAWAAMAHNNDTILKEITPTEEAYAKVDANTALVKEWKLKGPPFTIYRRPGDGVLTAIVGRPDNPLLLQAEFLKPEEGEK
jgi:hypothetical protein